MSREVERRYLTQIVEWRAEPSGTAGPGHLVGYAAVFGKRSQDLGGFVEVVERSAFTKTVGDAGRVLCRFNHKDDCLLGTSDAGTLTISVDSVGLRYDVTLPDTSVGRDVAVLAERGDLRNSSFAFETIDDSWGVTERGYPERRLLEVRLVDVAPVVNPAYLDATTGMRSLADHLGIELDVVKAKPADELRALITGAVVGDASLVPVIGAPVPNLTEEEDPEEAEAVQATQFLEQNSLTAGGPRETHPVPVSIRSLLLELERKR